MKFYRTQTSLVSMETEINTWSHWWQTGSPHYLTQKIPKNTKHQSNQRYQTSSFLFYYFLCVLTI